MAQYKFQTDGSHLSASKHRPSSTGFGWLLTKKGKSGFSSQKAFRQIEPSTNNVAEWLAVVDAVEYAKKHLHDAKFVIIETDSELVVKQVAGEYQVKDQRLKAIKAQYNRIVNNVPFSVQVKHIPREKNQMADSLSKLGSLLNR
ncbi:MAG: hypothetical protein CME55_08645 [Halieaceae bacterium]|nr:hypothetical protein [Halieaceae bacterium]|tara:strand:- start:3903 stop:4334 length:432 start_codon:yes stop_codon:yes gene_type:complete